VTLTAQDVAQITRLLEESNFDELYLEIDGLKLSVRRGSSANVQSVVGTAAAVAPTPVSPAMPGSPAATPASPLAAPGPSATPTSPAAAPLKPPAGPASLDAATVPPEAAPPGMTVPQALNVPAPLLGTFYRAPKPGAAPFVEIGSQVEENTIVGIIEVMKLMNTVRAGVRGRVVQILGRDGALVEYGETLMRVSQASEPCESSAS
jgi:acetyl-CoA carboxylase biotin carboxyl carrier protein